MLFLELSVFPKTSAKIGSRSVQLTGIHQARTTSLVKYSRMLNTTNSLLSPSDIEVETSLISKEKAKKSIAKGKRPRGRPPKNKSLTNSSKTSVHNNSNLLDKFTDTTSYLEYASHKALKPTSPVFMGNLYELQVKTSLEKSFKIRSTLHQGGSNDKGIDINALWDPASIFNKESGVVTKTKYEFVNSKKIKPLVQRANQTIKLFVQCKCYDTSKIDPKLIREIKGSCQEYFKKKGNSAVFMIASTNGFTRTGKEDFDKATIPLIYAKFDKPRLLKPRSPYKIENWEMGSLLGIYLNPVAIGMFKGLDWIKFANKLSVTS